MFPGLAARRIAAGLTAALVAVLLVTFGGPSHAPQHRTNASSTSQTGPAAKAARVHHAVPAAHHHQIPLQLDLVSTPPRSAPDVRVAVTIPPDEAFAAGTENDLVTPTGRAPPAR